MPHLTPKLEGSSGANHSQGTRTMFIDWRRLGIEYPGDIDVPEVLGTNPEFDATLCLEIADRLRREASHLDLTTEFGADEYLNLQGHVHMLQTMHDQTHPTYITNMVKDLRSRVASGSLTSCACRRLKYNINWMLHVLLLSDCLRNVSGLARAVKNTLHLVVPPVLLPAFSALLEDPNAMQPHPSTVGRWRFLLDGSMMLCERSRNLKQNGAVRYMMADSSSQRGRTFQLTSIQTIALDELQRCFRYAADLSSLW